MAKLTSGRRFGGIFLILIGFVFIIQGFVIIFFGTTVIIDIISIFLSNLTSILVLIGLLNIGFGLFLIWAGRTIRNEAFLPFGSK